MSSYHRNYAPWNSSLSPSYKTGGASSALSSRDDISSSRYTSLAASSTYRPSFSGGTYRIKRDPTPSTSHVTSYASRYAAANSAITPSKPDSGAAKTSHIKRYTSTSSNLGKYGRSREPSPAPIERINRIKSREQSPVTRTLRGKSRDSSPVVENKCKLGYGAVNSYRVPVSCVSSSAYTSRYGAGCGSSSSSASARGTSTSMLDKSISYLSASDFRARSISRAKERFNEQDSPQEHEKQPKQSVVQSNVNHKSNNEETVVKAELSDISSEEGFVPVSVVTRATSPTPPGSAPTVQRTRRMDIAKTIEKTINRSTKRRQMLEKEIQSDRLDDSTRYSRFGTGNRIASYSPHSEARYSISKLRYSARPLSNSEKSLTSETKKNTETASRTPAPKPKSKLSPPKVVSITSRQSSVENLAVANANKPPAVPKGESPTKSCSGTGSANAIVKWPNKDFRKSALNVGPTDRPRKSRTPSSSTDSDAMQQPAKERSSSAGSEVSTASSSKRSISDTKPRTRCHQPKTQLTRHNSSTNLKMDAHKSCAPASSSSSGTDSSTEIKRPNKKSAKKKSQPKNVSDLLSASTAIAKSAAGDNGTDEVPRTETNNALQPPATNIGPPADSQRPRSHQEKTAAAYRTKKLSSVSNFFAARQNDTNSEPIFLESSESSGDCNAYRIIGGSLNEDSETNKLMVPTISKTTNSAAEATHLCNNHDIEDPASSNPSSFSKDSAPTNSNSSICLNDSESRQPSDLKTEPLNSDTNSNNGEQEEPSWWQDTSHQVNTSSALDFHHKDEMRFKLRHIDSGEAAWWLRNDEDDTLADDTLKTLDQEEDANEATEPVESMPIHCANGYGAGIGMHHKKLHSWWTSEINDAENVCNENDPNETNYNQNGSTDQADCPYWSESPKRISRIGCSPEPGHWWSKSGSPVESPQKLPKQNAPIQLKICRVESGERPWWLEEEVQLVNSEPTVEATVTLPKKSDSPSSSKSLSEPWWMSGPSKKLFNVLRVESGEKAWWQEDKVKEEEEELLMPPPQQQDWWQEQNESMTNCCYADKAPQTPQFGDEDSDDDDSAVQVVVMLNHKPNYNRKHDELAPIDAEVQNIINYNSHANYLHAELSDSFNFSYAERPPPLGQCASPIGLEEPSYHFHCHSPYQQPQQTNTHKPHHSHSLCAGRTQHAQYIPHDSSKTRDRQKLYISRHQNIDELLGGSCQVFSPLFWDGSSFSTQPACQLFLEEITPDQVRIHDSTAQLPYIQRMQRDALDEDTASLRTTNTDETGAPLYDQRAIDDAAIQVYKDGDYGAYLDLESSLAEQSEEIEGIATSRKNSLVVRTQLSVRVHAIIEKLLSAEGSDLRRALFSLKQVFQEDKDLVHAFVALGGLNCLVRVGNGADQNYQNYILRALGQVMLYVDGMNGVMKHEPTMQWLYSLIASSYRSVVKTALKLLLVFVEYAESNSYVLVNAIHAVDKQQGTLPWSNIMKLLKDYDNADAELVIYATSLINKTLAGLNDQDSFYDESDMLEQQDMESVIQRYISKPGTDLDLLDQLQLYEAVLKFEDGESDGIRLPDNSVRKTQRYRSGTDTTERRKSRRHSTGTSPSVNNKVIPSPKQMISTPGVLDEDSSESTNSTEFSSGLFMDKITRDTAGVTPGLRRRRERAERHKSFLKEQQDAAAKGIFVALEKHEELGQIVTAIPATINNGDSPPNSLVITNESNENVNSSSNEELTQHHHPNINYLHITAANATNKNAPVAVSSNNNNLLSPTKQLLGSNTISIINNSFDKSHIINNNNNNKLQGSPEFLTKKNLLMERNATVINGIIKNIQRGNEADTHNNTAYKKYENDANRLNNYYSNLATPKNNQSLAHAPEENQKAESALAAVLSSKKSLKRFDFAQSMASNAVALELPMLREAVLSPNTLASPIKKYVQKPELNYVAPLPYKTNTAAYVPPPPPPPPPSAEGMGLGFPIRNATVEPEPALTTSPLANPRENELQTSECDSEDKKLMLQLKRDHTVKDLTHKLSNLPNSPTQEEKLQARIVGDMSGLISKAKEGLAKSKSKGEMSRSSSVDHPPETKKSEPKKSENELHWEELVRNISRPLNLCDLDFTDLNSDDEKDVVAPRSLGGGVPPPPPPLGVGPPPMLPTHLVAPTPMRNSAAPVNYGGTMNGAYNKTGFNDNMDGGCLTRDAGNSNTIKKNKKTVKLFWKEVREDMIPVIGKTIWDEIPAALVDTQKLEHLFESRAKDLIIRKQQEMNKSKEVIVLDHKRSNAINIAMTKLPPPRAIKAAILKMDATIVTREGIDKLLNMLPTDEERGKIQEAQMANPELPLGSAEQFLLNLASISELAARLKLWAFRLDFDYSEKEIAEPLMDLKQGIEILRNNRTFRCILSTLLSVGVFLNGAPVKGFQIEYLAKVPEVKDTVHKHSLLHHLCHMVMESGTETTDLYSEIGPITRASKADFADLAHNLNQLEAECKASWDRLKLIAKHDCAPQLKQKLVDFLADCAERIIILQIVHRRVMNRYRKFQMWLGVPQHSVVESKPNEFCRIVSEFALEYRTTRERVQQQIEKKANHRERNKTRGKMIIDIAKFKTKEDRTDAELKELLGTPSSDTADGTLTWRRRRAENLRSPISRQSEENFTDGDDEILESLVKTATKAPGTRTTPRERKRTRHADRKSLRRTLKNGLTEEEKQHVAALIKTY